MSRTANLGAWLKKKRAERNLSQEELAAKTGLTVREVQRIEENDLRMGCGKYVAIADYFDVMLEEILYAEEDAE